MNGTGGTVITGIGVIAPNGLGTGSYWAAVQDGVSGLGPISRFDAANYPVRVAGEITDFFADQHVPARLLPQTDRVTQLALTATEWALRDAELNPAQLPDYAMGTVTSTAAGGFEFGQRQLAKLWRDGAPFVSAYQSFAWFYAVNTGQISIRHGLRGHGSVVVTEQAGGLDAIGHARRLLRQGTASSMVTGGFDALQCPWGLVAQLPSGRLSEHGDPVTAYLPFDRAASGYVPGEGGAILVLEDTDQARDRGAPQRYGEVAGYAATFDPPARSGRPATLARAIRLSLADAGLHPEEIGVVFADACAVAEQDRIEAEAITEVFGPGQIPVTAPKTTTGRLYAGGSALDVATALLTLRTGVIPPTTAQGRTRSAYELDLVLGRRRRCHANAVLVIARGHGGFNSAMVLRKERHE
ncbi:ketosynthase chain-length factor [Amycolatopsis panacis]|uniref:Ketosynthase chain-length factor n=1 Tax=Amycolatopsis panacis TaxID=2340917 RepID=A0A419HX39_9PSEU|nr:ketosynthase chain-length factor [Amycolatopsis panacis]RJQ81695.1 ketosynthase chain-length factor [Amycolatopsis panacis]